MKVLLVEDSATVVAYLREVCSRHAEIEFLEPARDGRQGVERALAQRPEVILMDLNLPELDGVSAIEEILQAAPIPIVVLSAHLDSERTFAALSAGAVEVLPKPKGLGSGPLAEFERNLVRTLRIMKEARVVRRGGSRRTRAPGGREYEVVLLGASTGGPQVLHRLLARLPAPYPLPLLVAQHTYAGFEQGLASWLESTGHATVVARAGARAQAERVYLAPADAHLTIEEGGVLALQPRTAEELNPSVDKLFESGGVVYGRHAVGVLLTGMGRDGAAGLLSLRRRGALTVTQLGETCVVDGMPAAARALGASSLELDPEAIAELLSRVAGGVE